MKYNVNPFVALFDLMYPKLCVVCAENLLRNEHQICLTCLHSIPKTNFHLQRDNDLEKRFWGKVNIHSATAFFYFQKGSAFQKILHSLKYGGNREIGELLGAIAADDLKASQHFVDIDCIVPVPLHSTRYLERGYNQSEAIGKGLALKLEKPMLTKHIRRVRANVTQTKKSVFDRYENTAGIFQLHDSASLIGKHILLVDDVVTTGSTLEACVVELQKVKDIKISIFALSVTRH